MGLIGCGRMGAAMGGHLLAAGTPLAVFDVAPAACAPLADGGAVVCGSPAEVAAQSDVVLVVVVDDEQTREAVASVLDGANAGAVIALCASIRPDTCAELEAAGRERGVAEWGKHRLRWPHKDLEVALAVAGEAGVAMPLVERLAELMRELDVQDLQDLL